MLSLGFEPVTLLLNELLALGICTLLSELDKVIPKPVTVHSLRSKIHTALQLIQPKGTM